MYFFSSKYKDEVLKRIVYILFGLASLMILFPAEAFASENNNEEGIDLKEIIFHHLGDGYGWEVPFMHDAKIPLPVIVRGQSGDWYCFSSAHLTKHVDQIVGGEKIGVLKSVIYTTSDGSKFTIGNESSEYANKLIEVSELSADEQVELLVEADQISANENISPENVVIDGYTQIEGVYYAVYKPFDISVTKNVLAIWISVFLVICYILLIKKFYIKNSFKAPRKALGFVELLIDFIYAGVIKPSLGSKAQKFAPYLLTAFFFILTMNLLGLIVIFPGGANLTGNIAVTLVLALLTFVLTNLLGTKHYWKEIFWPDVPIWLKRLYQLCKQLKYSEF